MSYEGKILWIGGKPKVQDKASFVRWLESFPEDTWFHFLVKPENETNNCPQSKLYFKWCDLVHKEFGWDSKEKVHLFFKDRFNGGESTTKFTTEEWSTYMTKVLAWAGENNIGLPLGEG